MTNPELNAYLDEHVFGTDQSQKMCGKIHGVVGLCVEAVNRPKKERHLYCTDYTIGTRWATCPHRKPYTPPDYCADPVAFFRLVEWCCKYRFAAACESAVSGDKWDAVLTRDGVTYPLVTAPTLPLALARAVYEAMKGNHERTN